MNDGTISAGAGDDILVVKGSGNTIDLGEGNDVAFVWGDNNHIIAEGEGDNFVMLGGYNNVVTFRNASADSVNVVRTFPTQQA